MCRLRCSSLIVQSSTVWKTSAVWWIAAKQLNFLPKTFTGEKQYELVRTLENTVELNPRTLFNRNRLNSNYYYLEWIGLRHHRCHRKCEYWITCLHWLWLLVSAYSNQSDAVQFIAHKTLGVFTSMYSILYCCNYTNAQIVCQSCSHSTGHCLI